MHKCCRDRFITSLIDYTMTQRIRHSRPRRLNRPRQIHGFEPLEQRTLLAIEPLGNEQLVNNSITRTQSTSSDAHNVAVAADGGFAVAFAGRATGDDTGVFIRRFDSSRIPRGPVERVNRTTHGIQRSPHLAMNAAGEHVVAWAGRGVGDHEGVFAIFRRYRIAPLDRVSGERDDRRTTGTACGRRGSRRDANLGMERRGRWRLRRSLLATIPVRWDSRYA